MSLDLSALGTDIESMVTEAAQGFYADAQATWATDEAFFKEIAADYKDAGVAYAKAKLDGDDTTASQLEVAMKQLTGAIRARVATRGLQLDAAAQVQISNIMWGVGKAIGSLLGGVLLAAL